MTATLRIIREPDIRAALGMSACIDACERAFVAYSTERASTPGVISLDIPEREGSVHVKAGHVEGEPFFAVKVASGFPLNASLGLEANGGLVLVFDGRTGAPAAILLDNGYITDLRTGAAGGVAARHLAKADVRTVAVIGTGAQARYQVDALAEVRPGFSTVRVWGRNARHAAACVEDLGERVPEGCTVLLADSVRAAVEGADVVITCTAAREPLVQRAWLAPGAHVTAVGADDVGKQELDPEIFESAAIVVVDSRAQCATFGELAHAIAAGALRQPDAVELGEICAGSHTGRTTLGQITVCDLTGVGVQDVAAANVVMENIGERGERLEI